MYTTTSRDGTRIACDVYGRGAPVILLEGAFCGRHFAEAGNTARVAA